MNLLRENPADRSRLCHGSITAMIDDSTVATCDRRSFLKAAAISIASVGSLAAVHHPALGQDPSTKSAASTPNSPPPVRVRIWCEGTAPKTVYPADVDGAIAEYLSTHADLKVDKARLADPASGLSDEALDATDTLIWWGHLRHDDVPDDRVDAVVKRVREGRLGLIALHSSYASKPFKSLLGAGCEPSVWREDGRPEHIKINAPDHPVAKGLEPFTIPRSDMFAEPFSVPEPETLILTSTWDQGETLRSGLTWTVEKGRVVYLRTGHDAFPVLFHPGVRQLVANAATWVAGRS